MWRVGRCRAAQREWRELEVRAGRNHEVAFQLDALPVQATVPVAKHGEQWKARGQVLVNHVGAPHFVWAAFTQAEQPGGVIDLAVQQHDGGNARIPQRTARLHGREALQLRTDVRGGVAQHPVHPIVGQGNGRLRAGRGTQTAITEACAIHAVAVPLWKTTASGGPENLDVHGAASSDTAFAKTKTPRRAEAYDRTLESTAGEVHGDFEADTQVGECWFFPHGLAPSFRMTVEDAVMLQKKR